MLYTYSDWLDTLEKTLRQCGVNNFDITRVDFAVDRFEKDCYRKYYKANKLLLLLIQLKYKVLNTYESKSLLGSELLTLRLQRDNFQVEYYNKEKQSCGKAEATARLEFRSLRLKRRNRHDIPKLVDEWIELLSSLSDHYEELQLKCNQELLKAWENEKEGSNNQRTRLNHFLYSHSDMIFSCKQLRMLFESLGIMNAKERAYEYKRRNPKLEYIKKGQLCAYINQIQNALLTFIDPLETPKIFVV